MRHLDRLSSLPDELIFIVLSFLPTKYSVRTRILSTRWKDLFAYVPFLDFDIFPPDNSDAITTKYNHVDFVDYDNFSSVSFADQRNVETTRINFIKYVSCVLSLYNVNPMDKFRLHCGTAVDYNFVSWINSVLIRNVKEIDVFVVFRQLEWLTREIFSCQRLSVLKIHGNFLLVVPNSACLPCLKTLHFRRVSIGLLSGKVLSLSIFPLLEDFVLDTCKLENVDTLDLSHPTIRQISIRRCKGNYVLVMDAPSLLCFEFFESLASEISENTKLTSLVKACISISVGYKVTQSIYRVIKKLVHVVSQARHLDLCMETIKIFGNPYSNLPTFSNLTCLEIGYVSRSAFASLSNILHRSNQLEAIIFRKAFIVSQWEDTDLMSFTTVPSCVSLYLKEIEFREFAMGETGSKVEGKLVEYFLRNCQFLERLKIRYYKSRIEQVEFTKKLLTFPKCSRDCQILIDSNYVTKE